MFASVAFPVIESNTHKPAIDQFQQLDPSVQISVIATMLALEFYGMRRGLEVLVQSCLLSKKIINKGIWGLMLLKIGQVIWPWICKIKN